MGIFNALYCTAKRSLCEAIMMRGDLRNIEAGVEIGRSIIHGRVESRYSEL